MLSFSKPPVLRVIAGGRRDTIEQALSSNAAALAEAMKAQRTSPELYAKQQRLLHRLRANVPVSSAPMGDVAVADITVADNGSIILVRPQSDAAHRWIAAGLIGRETGEPNARYRARRDNPLLQNLTALFSQASDLVDDLRAVAQTLDADVAIFGSTVTGTDTPDSDVDILVVGPISQISAQAAFKPVARRHKRPINVTVIEAKKLQDEISKGSAFWKSVLSGPTVPLKGTLPHVANP